MDQVSGKTKEYLQPNPGTQWTENITFHILVCVLWLTDFAGHTSLCGLLNSKLCLNLNRSPHIACAWAIDPSGKKGSVCNSQRRPRIQLMRSIDCNNNSYNYKFLSMITIILIEGTHSQRWFLVVLKTIRHGFFVFVNFLCLKKTVVAFLAFTIFTFYQCNV